MGDKPKKKKLGREEQAREELGHTEVSLAQASVLLFCFLLTILVLPFVQGLSEIFAKTGPLRGDSDSGAGAMAEASLPQALEIFKAPAEAADVFVSLETDGGLAPLDRTLAANHFLLEEKSRFETELEERSLLRKALLEPSQRFLTSAFHVGNDKAYVGLDGWLFYHAGIDYLTRPGFLSEKGQAVSSSDELRWRDPRSAILDFAAALRSRGITLVLIPTPVKPMLMPEKFSNAYSGRELLQNADFARFKEEMEEAGVLILDIAPKLLDLKLATGRPPYLRTDSHWTPEAMTVAARALADFIRERGLLTEKGGAYDTESVQLQSQGDIADMLKLGEGSEAPFPLQEEVMVERVLEDNRYWSPQKDAPLLVLGDSFSNIYSLEGMGWGYAAGFVEHLSLELRTPADALLRNDASAYATRELLAGELRRGHDRLSGKTVVVWQFAARELVLGDWKEIPMELGEAPQSDFFVPKEGQSVEVSGTIEQLSRPPRPGSSPYKDHVISIHLQDIVLKGDAAREHQAVVYVMGMKDNRLEPIAYRRPGDEIRLRLSSWNEVEARYGGINRSMLENDDLMLEEPCWGELIKSK